MVVDAFAVADMRTRRARSGELLRIEADTTWGMHPWRKSPRAAVRKLDTLSQPACVPTFNRAWPVPNQGDQRTTEISRTAGPGPVGAPGKPVVYFSDEASAVMRPLPGPARRLQSPLETLTWQEPPVLEVGDDEPQ